MIQSKNISLSGNALGLSSSSASSHLVVDAYVADDDYTRRSLRGRSLDALMSRHYRRV